MPDIEVLKMFTKSRAPKPPVEEQDGHMLPTRAIDMLDHKGIIVSGGQDGTIFVR
jgi:hypothetical protein